MWTRLMLILACCLASSSALAVPMPGNVPCDEAPCTPPTKPWYYWWSSWFWWDRCHDRGQHVAYLPPLPGWYYFRPYSVAQLHAQQEVARCWGGDPRNPYANLPGTGDDVIKWPSTLLDPRFARQRTRVEAPYRCDSNGQANPTAEDYQNMIGAAGKMRSILGRMSGEISKQDSLVAENFLERLVVQARCHGDSPDLHCHGAFQQQLARRPAAPASAQAVSVASFQSVASASAAAEIIKWPPALRNPRLARQREMVEAPYRRNPTGRVNLTVADCQTMISAVGEMKAILGQMTGEISTRDSLGAEKFLDQLAAEARGQARAKPAPASRKP